MITKSKLKSLALTIISDDFIDFDYHFGEKVISDVMVIWVSKIINHPHLNINENDRIIFSTKAHENKTTWDILRKWSDRYWEYFRQVEQEKVERFAGSILSLESSDALIKAKHVREHILEILESLKVDDCIEFMAILVVEWSRRLNQHGFLQTIMDIGLISTLDSVNDETFISVRILQFMDMLFQLE